MLRTFLEKRRVRRAFEKLVDPDTIESVLHDGKGIQSPKQGRIEFVLAFVRGDNPSDVSNRMARVTDIAKTHGALVHSLVAGLVIVAFGTHPSSSAESGSRSRVVDALRGELAGDVKVVHGAANGHYGLFGSEGLWSYSFLVPHFDKILGALSRLQFGEIEEFRP